MPSGKLRPYGELVYCQLPYVTTVINIPVIRDRVRSTCTGLAVPALGGFRRATDGTTHGYPLRYSWFSY